MNNFLIGETREEAAEAALLECRRWTVMGSCHISYCGDAKVTISKEKCPE